MEASTATRTYTFIHQCPNQILFYVSPDYLRDHRGARYGEDKGKIVEFVDNVFEADEKAAAKLDTDLDTLVAWLRNHEMFGSSLFEDQMPETQEPTVKAQTKDIFAAVARQDPDAIQDIIDGERNLHNRDAVISAGLAALEQLAEDSE